MPRIFDNIDLKLLPSLCDDPEKSQRADFCVGYFNLRVWRSLAEEVQDWSGNDHECCRVLVGMQSMPQEELREALSLAKSEFSLDNQIAIRLKRRIARNLQEQFIYGAPTNADEAGESELCGFGSRL